jgi:SAM-dependent methyltransferase
MAWQDSWLRISDAVGWRWSAMAQRLEHRLSNSSDEWVRRIMDDTTRRYVERLPYARMDALEISGDKWKSFGFHTYRSADFSTFDICAGPLAPEAFDVVIVEQVLEHVLWPYRAARHLHQMLRPGAVLVVTTPFLVHVHGCPVDCSRWTELGLKHLLAEGGFDLSAIETGSWGNRTCLRGSLRRVPRYIKWYHTLQNDPIYPMVVWAFARKSADAALPGDRR